jgi:RhoGEF domain
MTTPCLPPIIPSPFGKAFVRKPYIFSDVGYIYSSGADTFHYDHLESSSRTSRAVSVPASTSPPGKSSNDENAQSCYNLEGPSRSPGRRAYSLNAAHQGSSGSANCSAQPYERPFQQTETFPIFEDPLVSTENEAEDTQYRVPDRSSDQSWNWPPSDSANTSCAIDDGLKNSIVGPLAHLRHGEPEPNASSTTLLDKSLGKTAENFRRWASTFRHKRNQHNYKSRPAVAEQELPTDTPSALPSLSLRRNWHTKRISNASSRFVATVKTASLSNDSMSLLPRAHRYSRVSDIRATRSSDPRPSVDSQRPSSISSSDEGALRRSIKRRQILQEVLSSEESYVADLKALYSLFSTLLASISSISAQTRISIQRDVMEMLHLHEQIVNELHRVALRATFREWRYVTSPLRLSRKRHRKWQSLDAASFHPSPTRASHTDTAVNGVNVRSRGSSAHAADPAEVADVARVFRYHMTQFYVYEEYSAKYAIMVQELAHSHKNVPHWACYESGMEALANSLTSLNQRGVDCRKGLTAGDLLIKPIQRICKYPLFFGDLHKQTPVVDCPISHAEVDGILSLLRQMIGEINLATDNPRARERIQRRWLLQNRLKLGHNTLKSDQFRMLGHVLLCGVLHVAYQTSHRIGGGYMLCLMFKDYLLIAAPALEQGNFDIVATIYLSDAKVVSSEDGRGMLSMSSVVRC